MPYFLRKIEIQNEDDFNKIAEYNRNNRLGTEKISGEDVDIYLMGTSDRTSCTRDLHFVKRKAKESTGPTLLALDRAMQSKTAKLEIFERRIKDVEEWTVKRINKVEAEFQKKWSEQMDYDMEGEEEFIELEKKWSKKEDEYKIIIALQESKIEEMAKTQKQLIEKMEKLEERMINVEFPPIAPKIVNPFDLFIKTN